MAAFDPVGDPHPPLIPGRVDGGMFINRHRRWERPAAEVEVDDGIIGTASQ
ncbi:MAG: hypothetical protein K9N46_12465 [Candidatus Marinimicrobia bacterium]|nr:hypothetical protein [Candidatus Neomarinimicrobiota bacterium]MCF7827596.1 hypothetical protein [Candidatus Neomarinimicrobiota bacterium]MCF7881543.1 hypothetical protein [Candidatus Neomarinimicrobiota bacterium]